MTTESHNKTLGIMYLAYAALNGLLMLLVGLFFVVFVPVVRQGMPAGDGLPLPVYIMFMTLITIFGLLYTVPSMVAGYALLKRKPWARIAAIIGAVVAGMNFPLGTALCVYTFWFLFAEGGSFFDRAALESNQRYSLSAPSTSSFEFAERSSKSQREHEYRPPPQMPNWRD